MKKRKKLWISIGISLIAFITVGVIFFVNSSKTQTVDGNEEMGITVQKINKKELSETLLVTGEVVPVSEQKIYLEAEKGNITTYNVEENQQVKIGEPIFSYDVKKLDAEFGKAIREKELIQRRANAEKNQIAEVTKQIAKLKKQIGTESGVTQEDVNQLAREKIDLEIQTENTQGEIATAQEYINEVNTSKKEMNITSKIDGIVVKVNKNVEKTESGSNEPVIHIVSSEPFKVIGTMSEFDTVKIAADQSVIIRPKVFKDREWKGIVESVSQFPNDGQAGGEEYGGGGNVTMYPFKVKITDDTSELRQGFHVSLEIKLGDVPKALAVPHMAVLMDEEGGSYIYVLVDNKLVKRSIKTGDTNDEFIAVTEGVKKDELVVITPYEGMHDGMEVASYDEVE